ncbi:NADH-quinone oxidoreductase subunit A [Desulfovibrio inopinatus]|uniref:NADH-quinone oxidoreductase subunit A n=1 Tax=Desulfovibrio inopinatus TaxID=102109 RepID=UPI0004029210|nr:NADH-quinone oxidoreductase subunit A [Desulfovibrio inopinatus]
MHTMTGTLATDLTLWTPGVFTLIVYIFLVLGLIGTILLLVVLLNPRRPRPEKGRPYECGVIPTGHARFRFPTPFYLVAAFFLLFDVEAVYIVSWAVSFERQNVDAFVRMTVFIVVLLAGLFWIWRKGGLEWGVKPKR